MSAERSMREELDLLARRLEEREAELARLEAVVSRLEQNEAAARANLPARADLFEMVPGATEPMSVILQAPDPLVVRDPAVIELLKQSAGMTARFDHLRISVENLDRKFDAMARKLHEPGPASSAEPPGLAALERRDRLLRIALMLLIFAVIVLAWLLV